jgi:hypothetical protein
LEGWSNNNTTTINNGNAATPHMADSHGWADVSPAVSSHAYFKNFSTRAPLF